MGFLEKLGLVERDESPESVSYNPAPTQNLEPAVEVEAQIDSTSDIISTIYEQNGLQDVSNSIYTVRALIDTLPTEMTTAKKQTTVAGILAVSGKSVPDLLSDAEERARVLHAAQRAVIDERSKEIAEANADIESLKSAIEAATIKIRESEEVMAAAKDSVEEEIKVITELVQFCEGMGDQK